MEQLAEKELTENEEARRVDLTQFKEWANQQSFTTDLIGDLFLLNFLRGCNFDQKKVREKLTHYFLVKHSNYEVLQGRDPRGEEFKELFLRGIMMSSLSNEDQMIILRWEHCHVEKISLLSVAKLGFMLFDVALHSFSLVEGQIVIIDCKNFPFGYIRQLSLKFLKSIMFIILKAYPTRIAAVHIININVVVKLAMAIMKPLVPKTIASRIRFYDENNINEIQKHIPLSQLPKEYGGEGHSLDTLNDNTQKMLEESREWLLQIHS